MATSVACGGDDIAPVGDSLSSKVSENMPPEQNGRKSAILFYEMSAEDTFLEVTVERTVEPRQENRVEMTIQQGEILLDTNPNRSTNIVGLEVTLNDVNIPAWRFPPHGLKLRNLSASLVTADTKAEETEQESKNFSGKSELILNWSMLDEEGALLELRPVKLTNIDFAAQLNGLREGEQGLALDAEGKGLLWNWINVLEFRNFSMQSFSREIQP
ncbi:MAG: hypothetical protein VYC39_20200 [Myxococcota bacterium]|nr:hypothetical protein [Myxococcota bacterium]